MISYHYKYVFIHITKTGGSSIEKALVDDSQIFRSNKWRYEGKVFNAPLNHLTWKQILRSQALNKYQQSRFHKFTFVRNPWDRVISECFCPHIQGVYKSCETITDRIKRVCELSIKGHAAHFLPQVNYIDECCDIVVGKFEQLSDEFQKICDIVRVSNVTLNHTNKGIKQRERKPYQFYYDKDTIDLVKNTYRQDIDRFEYSFE